jgi:hypothetical protein
MVLNDVFPGCRTEELLGEKVFQNFHAGVGEDRFGMKLDAPDR